ncbi:hypothetical protein DXG01_004025 [Tephrocybe rancida]|nr:hypothetical protein DXG01_004025 [Tephrocybe rancida]
MDEYIQVATLDVIGPDEETDAGDSNEEEDTPKAIKSWNFIKLHLRKHLFDDIMNKGVSCNYSTKPNEKMHGPIKKSYLCRSNFKNYAKQLLEADHSLLVAGLIRSNIDALDSYIESLLPDPEDQSAPSPATEFAGFDTSKYDQICELGSSLHPVMFATLEDAHKLDKAFDRFCIRLGQFLTRFLPAYDIALPGGKAIAFHGTDLVHHPHIV